MTRRRLPPPPSVNELVELARLLAVEDPAVLPTFLWCVSRSSRAAEAFRTLRPSGVHLVTIRGYPAGARLISSSQAGANWLRRWTETSAALDHLIPPIALGDRQDDDHASDENTITPVHSRE